MEIILDSIKKLLGIEDTDSSFDSEIIMHINSVFMVLYQLGVGPATAFKISSSAETWDSFFGTRTDLDLVKSYMYSKVKLMFDPPQNSFLVQPLTQQIEEFEWRLQVQAESYALTALQEDLEETE